MIISDLNYLEEVNQENAVVGGTTITFDKQINTAFSIDQDTNVDVDIDVDKNFNVDLDSTVNISGNFANLTFDVTASGNNSFTEGEVSVITTGNLSEISGNFTSAVG